MILGRGSGSQPPPHDPGQEREIRPALAEKCARYEQHPMPLVPTSKNGPPGRPLRRPGWLVWNRGSRRVRREPGPPRRGVRDCPMLMKTTNGGNPHAEFTARAKKSCRPAPWLPSGGRVPVPGACTPRLRFGPFPWPPLPSTYPRGRTDARPSHNREAVS